MSAHFPEGKTASPARSIVHVRYPEISMFKLVALANIMRTFLKRKAHTQALDQCLRGQEIRLSVL